MLADYVQTGLSSWWAPGLAFLAGLVSFASPCVFPLVPGYLSFVSGDRAEGDRSIAPILLFIAGFSVVFTALGAFSGGALAVAVRSPAGQRVAGGVIIVFGLLMVLYALRVRWMALYSERRPLLERVRPGRVGALPVGMAFAAGWTPCIGPVLGGILIIASNQGAARGAFLLLVYSLGLGVPFLLVGLGVQRLMGALDFVKRNYRVIAGLSGGLMVAIGVLLVSGLWIRVLNPFLQWGSRFPGL